MASGSSGALGGTNRVTVTVKVAEWDSEPLAPVTLTLLLPAAVYLHVRVTDPEVMLEVRLTLAALKEHAEPPFCDNSTVPSKLFTAVTLTVEAPGDPELTVTLVGLVSMVKSTTWNVTNAE